jgi:hypothetical protein
MSTILKALRRLEQDRSAQGERPLREQVAVARAPAKRRRAWPLVLGLALCAGVGAGVLAFWLASERGASEGAATGPDQAQLAAAAGGAPDATRVRVLSPAPGTAAESAPAGESPAAPAGEPAASGLPAAAYASPVETVRRPRAGPRIAEPTDPTDAEVDGGALPAAAPPLGPEAMPGRHRRVEPLLAAAPSGAAPVPSPRSEPPSPALAPRAEPPSPAPAPRAEPPSPAPAPRAQPSLPVPAPPVTPAPAAEAPPGPEPAPVIAAAPPPVRAAVPEVRVERTLWHPQATRRVAVVLLGAEEPREVHEGDALGPLVVAKIEPSGVVFVHEGVELRRRVGD